MHVCVGMSIPNIACIYMNLQMYTGAYVYVGMYMFMYA